MLKKNKFKYLLILYTIVRRKLVKQGESTLMVSLPAKWIQEHNLTKGCEVELSDLDGAILISSNTVPSHAVTQVQMPAGEKFLMRLIFIPYAKGYDEIQVTCPDALAMQKTLEQVPLLIGFEVVEQRGSTCIIKNIAEGVGENFDQVFRRILLLLLTMMKDGLAALKAKDFGALERISKTELIIERYYFFCTRLLNKYGYKPRSDMPLLYNVLNTLEMCSDQVQDMFVDIAKQKKVGKDTPAILEKVILAVEEYHRLLYNRTPDHMIAFRDSTKKILVLYEKPVLEREQARLLFIAEAFSQLSHKTV